MPVDTPNLDDLYGPPIERVQKAVFDRLVGVHEAYLAVAPFFCFATGRDGGLDASPRGGRPGFVQVLDPHHLAFADWPGNNRIESLRNLQEDDRAAMLFLFPGLEGFLRINGRARLSIDPTLLARLKEDDRTPKAATVVRVEEVLFHCGRAINRARLWSAETRIDRKTVPSFGTVLATLTGMRDTEIAAVDAHYDRAVREELY